MTTPADSPFGGRRGPLDGLPGHPMLTSPTPADIWLMHRADTLENVPGLSQLPVGPDRWLVVADEPVGPDLVASLSDAVDLGHGYCRIRVSGPRSRRLLASGISLDLDERAFPVGAAAPTSFRSISIIMHASSSGVIDLYTPRSSAASLWEWLADAAEGLT